jgi:hypothetical protein
MKIRKYAIMGNWLALAVNLIASAVCLALGEQPDYWLFGVGCNAAVLLCLKA